MVSLSSWVSRAGDGEPSRDGSPLPDLPQWCRGTGAGAGWPWCGAGAAVRAAEGTGDGVAELGTGDGVAELGTGEGAAVEGTGEGVAVRVTGEGTGEGVAERDTCEGTGDGVAVRGGEGTGDGVALPSGWAGADAVAVPGRAGEWPPSWAARAVIVPATASAAPTAETPRAARTLRARLGRGERCADMGSFGGSGSDIWSKWRPPPRQTSGPGRGCR